MLVMTTVLQPLLGKLPYTEALGALPYSDRQVDFAVLEKLKEVPDMNIGGPKFTLAHIMLPHPPFIFGPNGESISVGEEDTDFEGRKKYYKEQVVYTNKLLRETIESILAKSKKPPVIIIQSDHGYSSTFPVTLYSEADKYLQMRNFSAYYLPGSGNGKKPPITNINTFRFIFDRYLGTNFGLLENHSYFSSALKPYDFAEISY